MIFREKMASTQHRICAACYSFDSYALESSDAP
jgi:hypothetical protein